MLRKKYSLSFLILLWILFNFLSGCSKPVIKHENIEGISDLNYEKKLAQLRPILSKIKKGIVVISYKNGILGAYINNVSIKEVMEKLRNRTNISYEANEKILKRKITVSFEKMELIHGIRKILNSVSKVTYTFKYRKNDCGKYLPYIVYINEAGKSELMPEEMELGFVKGKIRIRTRDVDVNSLLLALYDIADVDNKILTDKIEGRITVETEIKVITTDFIRKEIIAKLMPAKPDPFDTHFALGNNYISKGLYSDAVAELINCEKINNNHCNIHKVYLKLAEVYYGQGSLSIAVKYLRKALKIKPDFEDAKEKMRNIYEKYDPVREESKIDFMRNMEVFIKTRLELAQDYMMSGLYDKAITIYNNILNVDFQNKEAMEGIFEAYYGKADFYLSKKDYDNAVKALKHLFKADPESSKTWFKLGEAYFNMPDKRCYIEAIEAFNKTVYIKGKDAQSHYYLAKIYFNLEKYDKAKDEIGLALKEDPKKVEYYLLAIKICLETNRLQEVKILVKQSIELDFETENFHEFLYLLN